MFLRAALFALCLLLAATANTLAAASPKTGHQNKPPAAACYTMYYKTKDRACVDQIVKKFSDMPDNTPRGVGANAWATGFFAALFRANPREKSRLLSQKGSTAESTLFTAALYEAGMRDEAQTYAKAKGVSDLLRDMQGRPPLQQTKPTENPSDNDMLIGAFMASGDTGYIERILGNYSGVSDDMARAAMRVSMMQGRFGPTIAPPGRQPVLLQTVCAKYQCKTNPKALIRIMTLSSALWAVGSLAQQDPVVNKALVEFFDKNPVLKKIFIEERSAFANYMTTLALYAAIKDNKHINQSLSIYEHLGSGQDAIKALMKMEKKP